jgi:hypothetical protein
LAEWFWRIFLGGIFWEKFFGRIFWEDFMGGFFSGGISWRIVLGGLLCLKLELTFCQDFELCQDFA